MKKIMTLALMGSLFISASLFAQEDKSKRPSPPVKVSETIKSGSVITIDYSAPSLKGRVIGKDVEPKTGVIWRAGANEATVFETSKAIKVEDKSLPAGKYAFFVLCNENGECTLIFNKNTTQWGAYDYKQTEDALRVTVKQGKSANNVDKLAYTIGKDGHISLNWGTMEIGFKVQ